MNRIQEKKIVQIARGSTCILTNQVRKVKRFCTLESASYKAVLSEVLYAGKAPGTMKIHLNQTFSMGCTDTLKSRVLNRYTM